jgi:hypothetical protein
MPTPLSGFATTVYNNAMMVCGGGTSATTVETPCSLYTPTTNAWTSLPPMPPALSRGSIGDFAMVTIGANVFVFGGWNGYTMENTAVVSMYNGQTWTTKSPMPSGARHGHAVVNYNAYTGLALVCGGLSTSLAYLSECKIYNSTSDTWIIASSLNIGRAWHGMVVYKGGWATG